MITVDVRLTTGSNRKSDGDDVGPHPSNAVTAYTAGGGSDKLDCLALPVGAVAINLGCGAQSANGWTNLDNSPNARLSKVPWLRWLLWRIRILSDDHYAVAWPDGIVIHDISKPLPFGDESVDYVYTSHALEHLTALTAKRVLSEILRVLKPNALLRIVIPDLQLGAIRYLDSLEDGSDSHLAADRFLSWLYLSKPGHRDPHLWMYDFASISQRLREAGFRNITRQTFRRGLLPHCDVLDNRPDDSLFVEALK
jgi:predicted SAM-dependent methyltransferase